MKNFLHLILDVKKHCNRDSVSSQYSSNVSTKSITVLFLICPNRLSLNRWKCILPTSHASQGITEGDNYQNNVLEVVWVTPGVVVSILLTYMQFHKHFNVMDLIDSD